MIVYGKNVIGQLENDPESIEELYISSNLKDRQFRERASGLGIPVAEVPRSRLDKLTNGAAHNGVAARVRDIPTYTLEELLRKKKNEKGFYSPGRHPGSAQPGRDPADSRLCRG